MSLDGVFAVPIPEARRLLGNESRSGVYNKISTGKLEAVKDGKRTLITVRSIKRQQESWPAANIKSASHSEVSA